MFELSEFLITSVLVTPSTTSIPYSRVYAVEINRTFHSTFPKQKHFCTEIKKTGYHHGVSSMNGKTFVFTRQGRVQMGQAATERRSRRTLPLWEMPSGKRCDNEVMRLTSESQNGCWSHYFVDIPCGMFIKYFFHKLKQKLLQMDLNFGKINGKSCMLM